jgi:hypothetical protein
MTVTRSAVEMAATAASVPATSPDSRPSAGSMPEFFRRGVEMIARSSPQPDLFTKPIAPRELHDAEASEHYFDIEMLHRASTQPGQSSHVPPGPGAPVPATRYEFIDWCSRNNVKPPRIGLLPYAIVEWTQRLTLALAEYRAFPNDPNVQARCLLYAGILSHYSADLCQPLHTTIHYDGRAKADGSSPHTGIHIKVDALIGKLRPEDLAAALPATAPAGRHTRQPVWVVLSEGVPRAGNDGRAPEEHQGVAPATAGKAASDTAADEGPGPAPFDHLMPAVLAEFATSHALVDKVYELEPKLPNWDQAIPKQGK